MKQITIYSLLLIAVGLLILGCGKSPNPVEENMAVDVHYSCAI